MYTNISNRSFVNLFVNNWYFTRSGLGFGGKVKRMY